MFRRIAASTIVITMVLAACTGSDDAASDTAPDGDDGFTTTTVVAERSQPTSDEGGSDAEDTATNAVQAVLQTVDLGRSIVFTADITVEVDDVVAASEQARAAVAGLGGILFGQETTTGPDARSVLTVKVPPEHFSTALERLAGIGSLRTQNVRADDVTERVVDLESQITTAAASVERLRGFLDTAADLEDLAALERELLQRETDLEVLRGRLRTLEDQVALATIVLVLTEATPEPGLELIQTAYAGHDDGAGCPGGDTLTIDEGDAYTLCYALMNVGDTRLDDLDLREPGLDADLEDMLVVEGDASGVLEPGARVVLALEVTADPATWVSPEVTVRAVDGNGAPLRESVSTERDRVDIDIVEDTSLPGFTDAVSTAWNGLQQVVGVAVFAAGIAVPFLWVPVLLGLGFWLVRRRNDDEAPGIEAPAEG